MSRYKPPGGPLNVAVLSGGESAERQISLASGRAVIDALTSAGHRVRSIDPAGTELAAVDWSGVDWSGVDWSGVDWSGVDWSAVDWSGVDVCFIALHGGAGEDGRIQAQLDSLGVAYTGSGPAASRLAMSKSAAKTAFRAQGVPTPAAMTISRGGHWNAAVLAQVAPPPAHKSGDLRSGIRENSDPSPPPRPDFSRSQLRAGARSALSGAAEIGFPVVVKPDGEGSSLGVGFAADEAELRARVAEAERYGSDVMIEQWIDGREFTVAVLGRRPLPLIEIITPRGLFDYEAKYESAITEYRFEHGLTPECEARLLAAAVAAAQALGTDGLCRVDLMLDGHASPGGAPAVWVLEVNTSPGLTDHSLAPKAAAQAGLSLADLCDWMLRDALAREVTV